MKITKEGEIVVTPVFHEREFVYDKELVFVIMPFGEPWSDRIWDALQRIIVGNDFRVERADNRHGPVVTEDIWRGLVESRIILADVTGWNPNVFYEIGIAHTLGKDTILITQPSARLPFDTQGFRHVIYSDNPSGIKLLEREIPLKIDFFTTRKRSIKSKEIKGKKIVVNPSEEINAAWNAITNKWTPALPPVETKDLRSNAGTLKKRMKEYVYVLSESDAKLFVSEVKKIWPSDFEKIKDQKQVQVAIDKISNVLNEWRNKYSGKLNK